VSPFELCDDNEINYWENEGQLNFRRSLLARYVEEAMELGPKFGEYLLNLLDVEDYVSWRWTKYKFSLLKLLLII